LLDTRVTQNETDITSLETATGLLDTRVTQNETDITSLETATGLLEVRVTQNETDITALETATGLLDTRVTQNETDITSLETATGLLEVRVTQNETDITALETATGNLDTRVTQNTSDITSVSGLLYNNWKINVTGNIDDITSEQTVVFTGINGTDVTYNSSTNTVSISASGGGSTVYTAGSGLTLVGTEFNVHGGSGHFINLDVEGAFTATTKSFLIEHPSKSGMKLQYGSLEGPENGVYVRGTTSLNKIILPDYWKDLIDEETITVTLTPVYEFQPLFVKNKNCCEIEVGGNTCKYDYVVYAERKDVKKLEVEW